MSGESDFIGQLRGLATHPAARGLTDEYAVLCIDYRGICDSSDVLNTLDDVCMHILKSAGKAEPEQ